MLDWLAGVVDKLVCYVQTAATLALNALIAALGAFWGFIVGLLPEMPGVPPLPGLMATAAGYVAWFVEVEWLVYYLGLFFSLLGAVMLLLIPLRWLKAVD
jgi:hypothetical protein